MKNTLILLTLFCAATVINAQEKVLYKQVDDSTSLYLEVISPVEMDQSQIYPAMVFFFGGGWNGGNPHQFKRQADHFSSLGIVCFLVDYRVKSRNNTSPYESLKDAKSAMRYVRANAAKFNINPDKIVASGGSAGGHLAAASTICEGYDESTDDLSVSSKANALVLYNPVIDNGPGGYGYERIGSEYKSFSPLHNIQKGVPPTLLMLGTKDHLIPVATVEYYKVVMDKVKSPCDIKIYEGGKHGFFNYKEESPEFYNQTTADAQAFLESLGYITTTEN